MHAVAILLVASTMGGDFPTNSNTLTLPPVLKSAQSTRGSSLLDQAMQATADTASETASSAGNSLRRTAGNALRRTGAAARNVRRTAGELSLSGPKGRVAQAQYQQGGLPKLPVSGLTGPGNRAAAADPTLYQGRGLQPVPPATGYNPAASMTPPPTASSRNTNPTYRPPPTATNTKTNPVSNNTGYNGLELPPLLPAATTAPERNYGNTRTNPANNGLTTLPRITSNTNTAPTESGYRPPIQPTAVADPYAARKPIGSLGTASTGTVIPPVVQNPINAVGNAGRDLANGVGNAGRGLANGVGNAGRDLANGVGTAGRNLTNGLDNEINAVRRTGGSYFMTLLALFASVGLNLYLGWIAWDTYNRYQDLVSDMRTTGSRRERRPERRRFTETSAAAY